MGLPLGVLLFLFVMGPRERFALQLVLGPKDGTIC